MGVATTMYTTLGGIRAVIWNDVIQFTIVMSGIFTTCILTINTVDGGLPAVMRIGNEFNKWRLFDFSFDITSDHTFWAMFVGGVIMAVATMGTDQAVLQRYFTAKSEQECSRSVKVFSFLLIPYNAILLLIGVFLFAFYHQNPELAKNLPQSDAVLGHFAVNHLPRFVGTLLIGAVFAASMGVMSAGINSLSTCTVVDFYQRLWKGNESDEHYVRAGRYCTVLWGVLTTFGALYADRLGQLALAFGKIQGFVGGVMLGVFLLGIFFRRANASGALIGSAIAMAIVTYVAFWTNVSFFWYGAIGSSLTLVVGYLGSLLGSQPSVPENLFFQRTRS
jgi:SSS family transporter